MDVKDLTQNLADFSPKVNEVATLINQSSRLAALIIVGIMLLLEMDSWYRSLKEAGGGITREHWLDIAMKYVIALFLVSYSATILDAILELVIAIIKTIANVLPTATFNPEVKTKGINGFLEKNFISLTSGLINSISGFSIKMLVFMRAFQMYILKAIAPLMVAFWLADSTREIAKGILKDFAAAAIQGLLIYIIANLYPALVTDDIFRVADGKDNWGIAMASIFKGIVYLFLIFGSQRMAKKLMATT